MSTTFLRCLGRPARAPVLVFVLTQLALCVSSASAQTDYVRAFYPDGLPVRHTLTATGTPTFLLLAESQVQDGTLSVVLFAEKLQTGSDEDWFNVFWGIARRTAANQVVAVATSEITHYVMDGNDEASSRLLRTVSGTVNTFLISSQLIGVHLNIYGVKASENGGGSDVLLAIDKNSGYVQPVLELVGTSAFARVSAVQYEQTDAAIYLIPQSGQIAPDLAVWPSRTVRDVGTPETTSWSNSIAVYRSQPDGLYGQNATLESLPSGAVRLERSLDIPINVSPPPDIASKVQSASSAPYRH